MKVGLWIFTKLIYNMPHNNAFVCLSHQSLSFPLIVTGRMCEAMHSITLLANNSANRFTLFCTGALLMEACSKNKIDKIENKQLSYKFNSFPVSHSGAKAVVHLSIRTHVLPDRCSIVNFSLTYVTHSHVQRTHTLNHTTTSCTHRIYFVLQAPHTEDARVLSPGPRYCTCGYVGSSTISILSFTLNDGNRPT